MLKGTLSIIDFLQSKPVRSVLDEYPGAFRLKFIRDTNKVSSDYLINAHTILRKYHNFDSNNELLLLFMLNHGFTLDGKALFIHDILIHRLASKVINPEDVFLTGDRR